MARGRIISRTLGTSRCYASLQQHAGKLAEFAQALYPLLVVSADDFGRQAGDAFTIKHAVWPTSPRTERDFSTALKALDAAGLVKTYTAQGIECLFIVGFDDHQLGLHKRRQSSLPPPPGAMPVADMNERDFEARVVSWLLSGELSLDGFTVTGCQRQARVGSGYADILAQTEEGPVALIELKRHRLTDASVAQTRKYRDLLLNHNTFAALIGFGLTEDFEMPSDVVVLTYGDDLRLKQENRVVFAECEITFRHVKSHLLEGKRTEEEKEEEQNRTLARRDEDRPGDFAVFYAAYPKKEKKPDALKAWNQVAPTAAEMPVILAAIARSRASPQWLKDNGQFIPLPASWLRNRRWEDQAITTPGISGNSAAALAMAAQDVTYDT